jgi:hypothetical protein
VLLNIDDFAEVEEYLHYKYETEKLEEAEAEAANSGARCGPAVQCLSLLLLYFPLIFFLPDGVRPSPILCAYRRAE